MKCINAECGKYVSEGSNFCNYCGEKLTATCSVCDELEPIGSRVCQKELTKAKGKLDCYVKQNRDLFIAGKWKKFCHKNFILLIWSPFVLVFLIAIAIASYFPWFSLFFVFLGGLSLCFISPKIAERLDEENEKAKEKAKEEFMKENPEEAGTLKKGEPLLN